MVVRRTGAMDGRGRGVQQVGTERRFWWRALEAPEPEPVFANVPDEHDHPDSAQVIVTPDFTPSIASPDGLSLSYLPGERRAIGGRRRKNPRRAFLIGMSVIVAAATAAAGTVLTTGAHWTELQRDADALMRDGAVVAGFGISQVSIAGHHQARDTDIYNALDLENVKTYWDLDAKAAVERIERISWVDRAEITRLYPNALRIDIRERKAELVWSRGSQKFLIDATGRVLAELSQDQQRALPHVIGEGANSEIRPLFLALSRHGALAENVLHAERIAERRWRVVSRSGSWIELAAEREADGIDLVASRIELARAFAESTNIIDVRTPGRITIRPRLDELARVSQVNAVPVSLVAEDSP